MSHSEIRVLEGQLLSFVGIEIVVGMLALYSLLQLSRMSNR